MLLLSSSRRCVPFLKHRGDHDVERVAISHLLGDHHGGAYEVPRLKTLPPEVVETEFSLMQQKDVLAEGSASSKNGASMKAIFLLLFSLTVLLTSCAPTQPHIITYRLNDSYPSARDKIASFHKSQERKFSLIQDQMISRVTEVSPGHACKFSLSRHAFDIGTRPIHHSALSSSGSGSVYQVTEDEKPETLSLPALLKLNPPPHLQKLDSWVRSSLSVQQRSETGGPTKR
jgi:hypothetical protein